jgi:hypothetical protein
MFLGIALGAGIYEARVVIPLWFFRSKGIYRINSENLLSIDSGRKFWGFITTVPLTLLTILNIILATRSTGDIHVWWLTAALITLLERLMTFLFFIPTIIKLQKGNLSEEVTGRKIFLWIRMNYLRNILTLVAWILAMHAIMISS